jgi:uncharacterized protein (DUF2252 family)
MTIESTDATAIDRPPALHLTVAEREARGRAARARCPRGSHSRIDFAAGRDPVAILEAQAPSRVSELVPIRYGRMLVSPFTFFRGAAAVMAHDLASTQVAGLEAQLCGDAHLGNFGGYASPERSLVFDLNDFDETLPGPFEWDVKRLAASVELAARDLNFTTAQRRKAVLRAVVGYREAMASFAGMSELEVWYSRFDVQTLIQELRAGHGTRQLRRVERATSRAYTKDSLKALARLTEVVDGAPRIVSDPPLIVPLREMTEFAGIPADEIERELRLAYHRYRRTLQPDRRHLLEQFRWVELGRKVVGVGSVGTRCMVLFMLGCDNSAPLFLQVKEAQASVLEPYLGRSPSDNHGRRVVEGQRLMQATSDILLGWVRLENSADGVPRDFYLRQLWDWKLSAEPDATSPDDLQRYASVCGWTLARAHARSGDRIAIASYLGASDAFDRGVAEFASVYAEQTERDHAALVRAARDGRITALEGI